MASGAYSMTDSIAVNEDDDQNDRLLKEFMRTGNGGTLATRAGGFNLIDVSDLRFFPTLSPHRKALLLILLLCLKDRATELRFEPQDTDHRVQGLRVSYVVNGEVYELVPPPFETAIEIIEEIKGLAGLVASRRRMSGIGRAVADRIVSRSTEPTYGGLRIGAGSSVSEVAVMVLPSPQGDRILMQISRVGPAVARVAEANFRQLFANHRNAGPEDEAEGSIRA
jgi:hypothetical protein